MGNQQSDLVAIRELVAQVEKYQNAELVDGALALYREDAVTTNVGGLVLVGRDAIAEFIRRFLPGSMEGLRVSYEVVHVVFIRPDVAAVKLRQTYVSTNGEPSEFEGEGSPLWILSREADGWRKVATQNTRVSAQ
ncbi:SgcJ/EcaC family oxidoreductase [Pseudonocardiaceae bacterium YIM PH 21723]|nr:SgcJ/EcaC family oxidoreductase [Pseudonocardiaceae bacterium YIM PH 21723]